MGRIRAGSRLGGCLHSLTVMHECAGLTFTHAAQCQNQAVSWPEGSGVPPEEGGCSRCFNSLEQGMTRDLVMQIHLVLSVQQVQQMGLYSMAKLKAMGGFPCKMPNSHGSMLIRWNHTKKTPHTKISGVEKPFLLLGAETFPVLTAWLLSRITSLIADSTS